MKTQSAKVYVTDTTTGKTYESGKPITPYNPAVPEQILTESRTIREKNNLKPENCKIRYEVIEDN